MNLMKQTLSLRLAKLASFRITEEVVWDIGCDHGDLGLSFLGSDVKEINLLDPSAPVIETLKKKLSSIDSYITKQNVLVHHLKGQSLNIKTERNIIFIAGMGGKEIGEIVTNLLPQLDTESQIVISPHRKILELRELLNSQEVELVCEESLFEEDQFYQILVLKRGSGHKVSLYGEGIWSGDTGQEYKAHQIRHFSLHQDPESRAYVDYLRSLNI